MKRTFALIIIGVLLMCASSAFAAGTCPAAKLYTDTNKRTLILSCVAHTDGTLSAPIGAPYIGFVNGMYLYSFTVYPGGTAPTDDSDLDITASRTGTNYSEDILGGNGTDAIDATTTKSNVPKQSFSGLNFFHIIDQTKVYTVNATNNVVNAGTVEIELVFLNEEKK